MNEYLAQWAARLDRAYQEGVRSYETPPRISILMYDLVRLTRPQRIVEYGAHVGASTAWLGLACKELNCGHVHAYEIDHGFIEQARENLRSAIGEDWSQWVTLFEQDALKAAEIGVDFCFLDVEPKEIYWKLFVQTRWAPGAICCAHDMVWDAALLGDFLAYIRLRPDWQHLVLPDERGLLIARFRP